MSLISDENDTQTTLKGAFNRELLFKELSASVQKEASKSRFLTKYNEDQRKFSRIRLLLMCSGYDPSAMEDKAFKLYGKFFLGGAVAYVLSRRMSNLKTFLLLGTAIFIDDKLIKKMSFQKGLYKHAVHGSDESAQESRLLLAFFFPNGPYKDVIWSEINAYKSSAK